MVRQVETVIVGGGQAGLAVSYYLSQKGREHVVLEAADKPAHVWQDERWDSFTLVTPNWAFLLPGAEYHESDPEGYMNRDEVIRQFENYVEMYHLPVQCGARVSSVEQEGDGYAVKTDQDSWQARNVVVAIGTFQKPKVPAWKDALPAGFNQVTSAQYRNPESLPPGAILIVGTGQSGCQIAEELYQSGRNVYLSVGSSGRAPRRYRGRDMFDWLNRIGFFDRPPDPKDPPQIRFSRIPHLSGTKGGHALNLHQFYRDGVVLLGHLEGVSDGKLLLAGDLRENLVKSDGFEVNFQNMINGYIEAEGLDAPKESLPVLTDGYSAPEIRSLDMAKENISTLLWAQGFTFDFHIVKLPVFDQYGLPLTERGATRFPGLFFAGLAWQPGLRTALFLGVGNLAKAIAEQITAQ